MNLHNKKNDPTIDDVASAAGVSVSTVSRILNNKPDVAETTKAHVLEIIEKMGYEPHSQAKRLAAGTSRTIALFDPLNRKALQHQPINQLHLDFMIGAATAAGEADYFFNVVTAPTSETKLLKMYRSAQIDGSILMEIYLDDPRVNILRSQDCPFVMIGQCRDNTDLPFIDLDFGDATRTIFDHLVSQGHSRIGFMGFPPELREKGFGPAVKAWEGYLAVIRKYGLPKIYVEVPYAPIEMADAARQLLHQNPDLTAIVALTDAPMAGVIQTIKNMGRSVPEDVSVVGLAIDRLAEIISPGLSAVRFPSYEMGYQAARLLINKLNGQDVDDTQINVNIEFILRGSSGPRRRVAGKNGR